MPYHLHPIRPCRPPSARPRSAFTLIELLVVLGIITLLVGLLVPAVSAARKESRKTVCKSQLQQIGHAFRMYIDQNRGRYPRAPALPSANLNGYPPLFDTIGNFVNNDRRVFHCPADETVFPDEGTSYFYNSELGERPLNETFFWTIYRDVTKVPVVWDAGNFHGGSVPFNWLFVDGHVENLLRGAEKGGS